MNLAHNQESTRPEHLTPNFFSTIMITEAKRKATLQIVSFNKKRDKVYSTKMNDGYFVVKVMMINEAATQLESQMIKPLDILDIWIKNHGEGVVVIKEAVNIWKYDSQIGQPVGWRLKKQNINYKGSNLILWESQRLNISQIQTQKPKVQIQQQLITSDTAPLLPKQQKKSSFQNKDLEKMLSFMFQDEEEPNQQVLQQKMPQQLQVQDAVLVSIDKTQTKEIVIEAYKQKSQERFQNILDLLLTDEQDEIVQQVCNIQQKKQVIKEYISSYKKVKNERKKDLQFIFDCLNEDSQAITADNKFIPDKDHQQINHSQNFYDDDSEQLLEWILKKDRYKKASQDIQKSANRENIESLPQKHTFKSTEQHVQTNEQKRRQDQYRKGVQLQKEQERYKLIQLLQSYDQIEDSLQEEQCGKSIFKDLKYLTMQNIYHGFTAKEKNWHTKALLRCCIYQNNLFKAILCDQMYRYPINAVFSHLQQLNVQLKENHLYSLGRGKIKETNHPIKINCSYYQLQFDGLQAIIEQEAVEVKEYVEPAQNYCLIQNIYNLDEGIIINWFGVLKGYKYYKSKSNKGGSLDYEIADPLTKATISFVQFQVQISDESVLKELINRPITIFNGLTSSYKGKKNLLLRPNTIIKYDWLPFTKIASNINTWLTCGNDICQIETQLVGYNEVQSLSFIGQESSNYIFIRSVFIIEFKNNFMYKACVNCLKKVVEMKCVRCGPRKPEHLVDRLFLRGAIADSTAFINVIFSNQLAQIQLKDGFPAMQKKWLLKKVSIWLQKGSNDSISVIRMKSCNIMQEIKGSLEYIKRQLL